MPTVTKHTSNNLVTVSYPVREAVLDITHAEHALILMFSHEKVKMIKFIRSQYNLGFYVAKQVVDTVIAFAEAESQLRSSSGGTETDWSKVQKGTRICVRDSEHESWTTREFIAYYQCEYYKFICSDDFEGSLGWKYAKLINNQ